MSNLDTGHAAPGARALVVVLALLATPLVSAEPRERWPGEDRPAQPRDGTVPDLLADLLPGECNAASLGAIAGATLGGVLGARIGNGDGGTVATVAGTLIGALIGGRIGHDIDQGDERCRGAQPPPEIDVLPARRERAA